MDYEVLESIITGCDILSEETPSLFEENGQRVDDDFFLSDIEKCNEYNILNLDNFVQNDLIDPDISTVKEEESCEERPNVFLLDDNVDKFEMLLQDELLRREMGNVIHISTTENKLNILGAPVKFECHNCEVLFDHDAHLSHVCEYNVAKENICENKLNASNLKASKVVALLKSNLRHLNSIIDDFPSVTGDHKANKSHICRICDRTYVHASGLARHLKSHGSNLERLTKARPDLKRIGDVQASCQCSFCGRIFSSVLRGMVHYKRDHGLNTCSDGSDDNGQQPVTQSEDENKETLQTENGQTANINYKSSDTGAVSNLFKLSVIESKLRCEFCDFEFIDAKKLFLHETSHNPGNGFECSYCQINVPILKAIVLHWTTECPFELYEIDHQINVRALFACNVCENRFNSLEELYEHRYSAYHFFPRWNVTSGALQIGCEKCGEFFSTATALVSHHEEVHSKTVKKVETCRPYLCEICGKGYTQSSHLYQHLRFHQGIKPFGCPKSGCIRRFTIRPDLNDHIRKCHTGERPYHCTECGKSFLTGSVFYQHRLIHRGERRYQCGSCSKRFHRSDALKNHERIHTGDKPFPCSVCCKSFRQKGDRDKHLRSRHKNQEPNANEPCINPNFYKNIINVKPITQNVNGIDIISMINSN